MSDKRSIIIELKVGDTAAVGGATITLQEKSGQRARLLVVAPPGMRVEPAAKSSWAEMAKKGVM